MNEPEVQPDKTHQVAEFKHDKPLTCCRIDPTGRYVFAGAEDLHVYRWDLQNVDESAKTVFSGHESWVRCMDFSADGKWLYTTAWDGQLRWWEAAAEKPASIRKVDAHRGFARWVRCSPCGQLLSTCGNDNRVRIWDSETGDLLADLAGHRRHPYALDFHPELRQIASQDLMGNVLVWDVQTATQMTAIEVSLMTGYDNKFAADMGGARDMRFDPSGKQLACAGITHVVNAFAGQQDPLVVLIDWSTKKVTHHLRQAKTTAGITWGVRFHPAGFIIAAMAGQNGKGELAFWRTDQEPPTAAKQDAAKASDGDKAKDESKPQEADDAPRDLKPFHTLALTKCARGLDLTPDASRLAVAHSDGALRVYAMQEQVKEPAKES